MTVVIDATIGGQSANSFVTEAEAIAFASTRLNLVGWTTVSGTTCTENEKKALIESARELSALAFQGLRTDATQSLAWPRRLAPNPDSGTSYYTFYDTTMLPQRVKDAACELAFEFLKAGDIDIASTDATLAVMRKKVDVLETDYAPPSQRAQGLARFSRVLRLITPLLAIGAGQVRLTR